MAKMIRTWLLIMVISDVMIFKMNAIQNSNDSRTIVEDNGVQQMVTSTIDSQNDALGIVLNSNNSSDQPKNDSNSNDKHTELKFKKFLMKNSDKNESDHANITSETSTESPVELEKNSTTEAAPLIPEATVKPNIKHPVETQQKIIIR